MKNLSFSTITESFPIDAFKHTKLQENVTLFKYQKQILKVIRLMERPVTRTFNSVAIGEHSITPLIFNYSNQTTPSVFIRNQVGTGKTLIMLTTCTFPILPAKISNLHIRKWDDLDVNSITPTHVNSNLIIVPDHLHDHWKKENEKFTTMKSISVLNSEDLFLFLDAVESDEVPKIIIMTNTFYKQFVKQVAWNYSFNRIIIDEVDTCPLVGLDYMYKNAFQIYYISATISEYNISLLPCFNFVKSKTTSSYDCDFKSNHMSVISCDEIYMNREKQLIDPIYVAINSQMNKIELFCKTYNIAVPSNLQYMFDRGLTNVNQEIVDTIFNILTSKLKKRVDSYTSSLRKMERKESVRTNDDAFHEIQRLLSQIEICKKYKFETGVSTPITLVGNCVYNLLLQNPLEKILIFSDDPSANQKIYEYCSVTTLHKKQNIYIDVLTGNLTDSDIVTKFKEHAYGSVLIGNSKTVCAGYNLVCINSIILLCSLREEEKIQIVGRGQRLTRDRKNVLTVYEVKK